MSKDISTKIKKGEKIVETITFLETQKDELVKESLLQDTEKVLGNGGIRESTGTSEVPGAMLNVFKNDMLGEIRTVVRPPDEVLFCLPDLCRVLDSTNPSMVLKKLDDDEVVKIDLSDCKSRPKLNLGRDNEDVNSITGNAVTNFVTEPGLYSVLTGSRSPNAKPFRRWVNHEVLPSIRKTGSYSMRQEMITFPEALLQAVQILVDHDKKITSIEQAIGVLDDSNSEMRTGLKVVNKKIRALQARENARLDYLTIAEYCDLKGIEISRSDSIAIGQKASKICKEHLSSKRAPHSRFRHVNSYPVIVLDELLKELRKL